MTAIPLSPGRRWLHQPLSPTDRTWLQFAIMCLELHMQDADAEWKRYTPEEIEAEMGAL